MDTRMQVEERELERLRADFAGWRIWRAVKQDGRLGEWSQACMTHAWESSRR